MTFKHLLTQEIPVKKTFKAKFPRIYRIIAEEHYWLCLGIGVNVILIACFSLQLLSMLPAWYGMQEHHEQLRENASLWENIGKTYPSYQDAYFQAALFAYQAGEIQMAQQDITKTLLLDPTSLHAQTLHNLLVIEEKGK